MNKYELFGLVLSNIKKEAIATIYIHIDLNKGNPKKSSVHVAQMERHIILIFGRYIKYNHKFRE